MSDMSNKNASTIVFPLPLDIMDVFKQMKAQGTGSSAGSKTSPKATPDE
jgi:hypothetical protein